jgi:hypothetical protein
MIRGGRVGKDNTKGRGLAVNTNLSYSIIDEQNETKRLAQAFESS